MYKRQKWKKSEDKWNTSSWLRICGSLFQGFSILFLEQFVFGFQHQQNHSRSSATGFITAQKINLWDSAGASEHLKDKNDKYVLIWQETCPFWQ